MLDPQLRKKIIIAADDFGISENSNRNILELVREGKVDRVAVMIDGLRPPSEEEVRSLLDSPAAIDIHLNAFQKIVPGRELKEGAFLRIIDFLWRFLKGEVRTSRMEKAWSGEIERFREIFGKMPDGISAHQHIHFFPSYFRSAVRLAKRFGIAYIRFGRRGISGKSESQVYRIMKVLQAKNKKIFERSGLDSSDFWFSLDWTDNFEDFVRNLPEGRTELVCHPERPEEMEILRNI